MTRVRTIGVALGFLVLMGVGAATLTRGQPPASETSHKSSPDVATLEAEVELLLIEHEVARENLRDFLKKYEHLHTLKTLKFMTSIGLAMEFAKVFGGKDDADSESKSLARSMALMGENDRKDFEKTAAEDVTRLFAKLQATREWLEQDFVNRTKKYNARKQALAEAQRKSRESNR